MTIKFRDNHLRTGKDYNYFIMLNYLRDKDEVTISMVCLGNICRSPMAAAILFNRRNEISSPKVIVDSSGTGAWHVGQGPNPHSKQTWEKHGLHYDHAAKKFSKNDFYASDLILVMDSSNYANVMAIAPDDEAHKVFYLRQFDSAAVASGDVEVPDPYSLAIGHFEAVYEMIDKAVTGLLKELSR